MKTALIFSSSKFLYIKLSLAYCDKASDADVNALTTRCTTITNLNLSNCTQVSDTSIALFYLYVTPQLLRLLLLRVQVYKGLMYPECLFLTKHFK